MTTATFDREELGPFASIVIYINDILAESPRIQKLLHVQDAGEANKKIHLGSMQLEQGEDQTSLRPFFLIAAADEFGIELIGDKAYRTTCVVEVYFTDTIKLVGDESYIDFMKFAGMVIKVIVDDTCDDVRRWKDRLIGATFSHGLQRTDPDYDGESNPSEGASGALERYWEGKFILTFR